MMGEATHGTEEFYRIRADVSRRLIEEEGGQFDFVAVEGDWPDCYRVNRFIQHSHVPLSSSESMEKDGSAEEALRDFQRFPLWMWRNEAVRDYVEWCRTFNEGLLSPPPSSSSSSSSPSRLPVAFYGMDLYSLFTSADAVIAYLEKVDKAAAERARERYSTLGQFRHEPQEYRVAVSLGLIPSQQEECAKMLVELLRKGPQYLKERGGYVGEDELFYTQLNALLVKDAEEYYRNCMAGGTVTWNLRDQHMVTTVQHLLRYHDERRKKANLQGPSRCILWAHNSHLGDCRATALARQGEWNVGQLVREQRGLPQSFSVGFTTYAGTVSAAQRWGGDREEMTLNPALPQSYEDVFHRLFTADPFNPSTGHSTPTAERGNEVKGDNDEEKKGGASIDDEVISPIGFAVLLRSNGSPSAVSNEVVAALERPRRLERAVGVQYVKRTERQSHYIECCLPKQFDAVLHIDTTHALVS